ALVSAIPYVALTLERHQIETLGERLLAEARLAGEALPWTAGAELDAACARLAADLGVRLTVIAADGRVLGESTRSSESLENHADRPEFRAALATGQGRAVRQSGTIGVRLLYTAWRQTRGEGRRARAAGGDPARHGGGRAGDRPRRPGGAHERARPRAARPARRPRRRGAATGRGRAPAAGERDAARARRGQRGHLARPDA